jgi:hypothetical protein
MFELMSFTGPMFHVFTEDEKVLWRDYIASLVPAPALPPFDLEKAMVYVVDVLRQRQSGTQGHQALLIGPDPKTGEMLTLSIGEWFSRSFGSKEENTFAFLGALRNPKNGWIVPGDAASSPLITRLLSGNGDMATAFRDNVPEQVSPNAVPPGPYTFKQVLAMWTDAGCPIRGVCEPSFTAKRAAAAPTPAPKPKPRPAAAPAAAAAAVMAAVAPTAAAPPPIPRLKDRKRRIYGMGRPH